MSLCLALHLVQQWGYGNRLAIESTLDRPPARGSAGMGTRHRHDSGPVACRDSTLPGIRAAESKLLWCHQGTTHGKPRLFPFSSIISALSFPRIHRHGLQRVWQQGDADEHRKTYAATGFHPRESRTEPSKRDEWFLSHPNLNSRYWSSLTLFLSA